MTVEQLRRRVPGGIGAYARGLLSGLAELATQGDEIDITLFASRATGHGAGAARDPLLDFGRPVLLSSWPGPAMTRLWDHGWLGVPKGFDVVHSVSLASPPRPGHGGGATVITVHDLAWRRYPEATTKRGRKWHEAALRRARDSTAHLVVTSGFVATDLINDGVAPERITIVQGGSDHLVPPDADAAESVLGSLGVEGDYLLTVGTLEPRKNVQRLVQAYAKAQGSWPEPWPLVVVGPEGWGPDLTATLHQQGVKFAGAVSNGALAGLYQRARAFAYVPLTEGYGLPPLEAMRSGTPSVVALEVPSVHDLGQVGEPAVLLVDPLDIDDIARGLTTILTDNAVRADLAQRGEVLARSRSWQDVARAHVELWRSLR